MSSSLVNAIDVAIVLGLLYGFWYLMGKFKVGAGWSIVLFVLTFVGGSWVAVVIVDALRHR